MKFTILILVLSASLAGCEGPADSLAREKREAIEKVCDKEADQVAEAETDKELEGIAKGLHKTIPEARQSMRDSAKRQCVTANLASH